MTRKTALVTGASSGIGLDLARVLAANGNDVVLVARGEDRLRQLAEELAKRHGITAHVIVADLIRPHESASIAGELKKRTIEVDVLVNNAGFGLTGPFAE